MIVGIFKGTNGSCGFQTGRRYPVQIDIVGKQLWLTSEGAQGKKFCPYSSMEALLRNWDLKYYKD